MKKGIMKVPTLSGKPEITNAMKAECIGEFTFDVERVCTHCAVAFHDEDHECEVCDGEIEYTETVTVPWDTCKEIYKAMATEAAKSL